MDRYTNNKVRDEKLYSGLSVNIKNAHLEHNEACCYRKMIDNGVV